MPRAEFPRTKSGITGSGGEQYRYSYDFDGNLIPDMRASNNLNYRVSWQTSLGGFGEELIEDNAKAGKTKTRGRG